MEYDKNVYLDFIEFLPERDLENHLIKQLVESIERNYPELNNKAHFEVYQIDNPGRPVRLARNVKSVGLPKLEQEDAGLEIDNAFNELDDIIQKISNNTLALTANGRMGGHWCISWNIHQKGTEVLYVYNLIKTFFHVHDIDPLIAEWCEQYQQTNMDAEDFLGEKNIEFEDLEVVFQPNKTFKYLVKEWDILIDSLESLDPKEYYGENKDTLNESIEKKDSLKENKQELKKEKFLLNPKVEQLSNEKKDNFKEFFDNATDEEIVQLLNEVQWIIRRNEDDWLKEYEDFFEDDYYNYVDITTSSDWEPQERRTSEEEREDMIIEDYGTEDEFIEKRWEDFIFTDDPDIKTLPIMNKVNKKGEDYLDMTIVEEFQY
jgi:hypothetical protein